MAYRYLIYSTGTTYSGTIVRESATNNPGVNEASLYSNFVIPEIQPLYLWQITGGVSVVPNSDSNISNYEAAIAPAPTANDLVDYGQLTGATSEKISKVTGATNKVPVFTAGGSLQSSGYTIPELTGLTTYTFVGSGGTIVNKVGNAVTIFSAPPTGSSVAWGSITGNLSSQTDLWSDLTYLSGQTANKLNISTFNAYTGATKPVIDGALTGVTNLGTGTTIFTSVLNRNAQLKSISVLGGLQITNNANNIIISGATTLPTTWGNITGTLSNQTDLWSVLTGKTNNSVFNLYTGTTAPATYYNKSQINSYTGQTATLIASKVSKVTGATANDIVTFVAGGAIQDSGKQFTTTVQTAGLATNALVPTELAVRNAINQAVTAAVILQGDWNATTNVPDLTVTGITTGYAWRVSVSGTTSLGGITPWYVGDMAIKSSSGWIRTASEDISAIWGNIKGTLSNQTDLQNALNAKLNTSTFATYTGTTVPNTYYNKTQINSYTASTLININSRLLTSVFATYTGTTAPNQFASKSAFDLYTGTTAPATYLTKSAFSTYTGTTVPNTYYNKTQIDSYTAQTQTQINSKLATSVFTGYTASTKNKDKKIQVVSTSTINVNVVTPTGVTWSSAPYSADTYLWSASSATTIYIKSAGTYEVTYHVVLKNDTANQTHSIGGYIVKNGGTLPNTATAAMIVGVSNSGELSLPPVVQTFANNDKLVLALFRIGSTGTVNLVANSVTLTLNKLT